MTYTRGTRVFSGQHHSIPILQLVTWHLSVNSRNQCTSGQCYLCLKLLASATRVRWLRLLLASQLTTAMATQRRRHAVRQRAAEVVRAMGRDPHSALAQAEACRCLASVATGGACPSPLFVMIRHVCFPSDWH